jgi:type IV pilus assembly protein PilW
MKRHAPVRAPSQRGLSLVELMVGLAIGLLVVVAVLALIVRMSTSRNEVDRTGRQIESGRYAIHKLAEDLRHAGYFGEFSGLANDGLGVPSAAVLAMNPCTTNAADLQALMALPLRPYIGATTASKPTCIPDSDFVSGSNVLVLRFASPLVTAPASLDAGTMYVQTTVGGSIVARGDVSPPLGTFTLTRQTALPGPAVPGLIRKYIVRMYFLSPCSRGPCSAGSDEGRPVPSLKMIELDSVAGNPAFSAPAVVAEGIERLAYDFGIDTSPPLPDRDGDGTADVVEDCAGVTCSADDLANIVAVTVYAVARDTEPTLGFVEAKTYDLGLAGTYTPATSDEAFRRHLYSSTLRLNNISMRGE